MRLLELDNKEELIFPLERASYEVRARRDICQFMVADGMANNENYKAYYNEYLLYMKAYDKMKQDFQDNYILPNVGKDFTGSWEVDFNTQEIKIYD